MRLLSGWNGVLSFSLLFTLCTYMIMALSLDMTYTVQIMD